MNLLSWLLNFMLTWLFYAILSLVIYCICSKIFKGVWIDKGLVNISLFGSKKQVFYIQAELFTPLSAITIFTIWNPYTTLRMVKGLKIIWQLPQSLQIDFWLFYGAYHLVFFCCLVGFQWIISHFDISSVASHLLSSSNTDHGWSVTITFALAVVLFFFGASIGDFAQRI